MATAFFTTAFAEEVREMLPARLGVIPIARLILQRHNLNVVVRTAFGADAAADAAFGDVDFATGQASDTGAATEHTDGVLALATGGGDADIADDHAFAVHARMSMPPRAGFFALVAVNALVQVDHQHLGPFDHAAANQRA